MKLRLPHKFQAALLAAIASVSFTTLSTGTIAAAAAGALLAGQQAKAAITIHENAETVTVDTSKDYNEDGVVYNATTGELTGSQFITSSANAVLTFTLDNSKLHGLASDQKLVYVSVSGETTTWGFYATGTNRNNKIVGLWIGNLWNEDNTDPTYFVSQDELTPLLQDDGKSVVLTANLQSGGSGTRMFAGEGTTGEALYNRGNLMAKGKTITKLTLNKELISSFQYQTGEVTSTTVSSGSWSKTYTTVSKNAIPTSKVDATLVNNARLDVVGSGNVSNLNNNGGDIVVANGGQLFLQTYQASDIALENDIYIGSSQRDNMGAVRFGNDGGHTTTLGGNIYLVENSSFYATTNEAASNAININGTVTDLVDGIRTGSTLTIMQGKLFHFQSVDLTALVLNSNVVADFGGNVSLGGVQMSDGSSLTIKDTASSAVAQYIEILDSSAATVTLGRNMTVTAGGSQDAKAGALLDWGATKTSFIRSASAQDVKTLTVDKLELANSGTKLNLENVNVVVTGAATAGVIRSDRNTNNGTLTVGSGASLALNGSTAWTNGNKYVNVDVAGGTLTASGASHVFHDISVTNGGRVDFSDITSTVSTGNLSVANGATLVFAGANPLSVNGNLTLAGTLDVSNVAYSSSPVTLASYTGTANIAGATLTGLGSHEATLSAASGALTLTFTDTPVPPQESFAQKYGTTLGTVQFVGDSITHGSDKGGTHNGASYRWPMHKIWTDTGVAYDENGYHVGNHSGNGYVPVFPGGSTYGGEDWDNRHSAQASGRARELINGDGRYANNTPASLVANYPSDVFFLMIGTNDTLSDYSGGQESTKGVGYGDNPARIYNQMMGYDVTTETFSGTSRMDTIVDTFAENGGKDSSVVVLSIPTWSPNHSNNNKAEDFATMKRYNEILQEWCKLQGDNVYFVDVNPGIIDVANTDKPFSGVPSMFNDNLHPSGQGDLIFAANIARQLGYAGRTVGLSRSASGADWTSAASPSITVATGTSQDITGATFTTTMGYTVDFGAVYGDGEANGWDGAWNTANINGLRVQVGDGTHTGTLTFSEAYVKWGDTVLYSRDNHVAGENFRIAYVNASVKGSDNVAAGYYVWMGDMLIGEALAAGTDSFNGIRLTSTGAAGSVTNLSWSDSAYAPTTTLYENQADAFHLVQVYANPEHDNPEYSSLNIDFKDATPVSGRYGVTSGNADVKLTSSSTNAAAGQWIGPVGGAHSGKVEMEYSNLQALNNNIIVVYGGKQTGNVSLVLDGGTHIGKGEYSGTGQQSIHGSYQQTIEGDLNVEVNNATLDGGIIMGVINATGTIANTNLYVNAGAAIGDSVYGGNFSANGTINGNASITVTGGTINGSVYGGNKGNGTISGNTNVTITGGIIKGGVYGGGTGGTINGTTNVTIEGNLPSIGGNITADEVTLRNVSLNEDGYNDGFDWYSGTITGTKKITLDRYKVADMRASLVTQTLEAKNSTSTTIYNLHLTACEVKVAEGSSVTLADTLTLGNTATYSGTLSLQDNLVIDMEDLGSSSASGAQSATSGYRSATLDVMKLAEGASTPSLSVHADTLQGAGALEGFEFRYDNVTGTLSASGENYSTYYIRNAGDTLDLTAEQATHEELQHVVLEAANGTVGVSGTNTLTTATLANDSTLTFDVDGSLAVNGAITGTGAAVVKTGEGTMTISSNNSETLKGGFTVSEGTVVVGNDLALGSMDSTQHDVELAGGTLDVNGYEGTGTGYTVEFSGGTLTNSGTNRGTGNRQLVSNATITADSEVNATNGHDMGFGTAGHASITVTFADGAVLEKTGDGTFWVSNATVSGDGAFKVTQGVVNFQKGGTYASDFEMAGGTVAGTINLAGDTTIETTAASKISAAVTGSNDITLTGDAKLEMTGDLSGYTGTIDNASSAEVSVKLGGAATKAEMDIINSGSGVVNATLDKDGTVLNGTQQLNNVTQSTSWTAFIGNSGDVTATGRVQTGRLVVGNTSDDSDAVFTLSGSNAMLNKSGTAHSYDDVVQGYGTFEVADGATQTLSKLNQSNQEFHGTLKATGTDSVLTVNSTLAGDASLVAENGGTIALTTTVTSAGDITIGQGTTLKLSGASTPLTMTGDFTLASGSTLDLSSYTFDDSGSLTLLTTSGSGSIVEPDSWDNVGLRFGESTPADAHLIVQGNSLVLTYTPPTPSDDLVWSGGDGNWSSDNWHTQADPDTPVEFTDGTSVTFKSGTSNVTLTQSVSAPTTTLQNGAVLAVNRDGNTLTTALAGNGTFVLDNNTTSLPNGVSLDQTNWHGIVRLTSTENQTNKDFSSLVTGDSWIELNGFTGYTNSWATSAGGGYAIDLSQNIILTDTADGQPAWIWTGMGSKANPMYEGFQSYVTGKWSGDGTLAVKYPTSKTVGNTSAQSFRFSGDISDWNGKITVHKNSAELTNIGLYFQGEATQVNVNIEKPRGQVFVHVGDGTESFSTSFNGTVDATTFEVKDKATATITGTTTVSGTNTAPALTGAGNLVVDSGENVVTLNGASNLSGTTTVNSGKLQLNAGGDMGAVTVNGGDFNSTGAADLTMDGLNVNGGTAHIGNSGEVDLGAITLSADGDLVLNTTVTASSLTTNGGTLTFAGANMLTTTGNINLSGGATFDLSNIKYSAAESDQVIILAHSESGTITLGGEYTFTNPQYADTNFSLTFNANNDLVLVVNPDVTKWPTGTSVSYTYGTGEDKQTHYDIRIEEMGQDPIDPHGYNFSQPGGGVVEFNPTAFVNDVYSDSHNIVMHSDTTIVVEEGKTVKLTGQLQGNGVGDNVSGNLTKDGAGTLEMAINSNTTGSQGDLQNIYEGSVDVLEGTLRVVKGEDPSFIAAANGTHVTVDKDATLIFEDGNGISIPTGHRGNYKPGDNRSVVLSAAGTPAIVQNAYISQDGVRPEDAQDGGRASLNNLYEFRIGNLQDTSHAISVELADITTQSMVLNGAVDIVDSDIKVSGYLDVSNTVGAPNKIHNNSTINFTGNWGHVNNTDVDKTSKINYSGEQSEYTGAWLTGQNKIEVGSTANGGVATRVIDDTQLTIDYTSDQYKGMALGSKYYPSELSLSITLSDLDMPEDLTGYKFTLTFEDFDTSYVFGTSGEYVPLADSDLNVSLFIPEYTGGQWEELVANVQAMYDPTSGNTVFMFQNVVVPEPTTGTLSLLALCALAARRRRK